MKTGAMIDVEDGNWGQLSVAPAGQRAPLSDCVRDALRVYLQNMAGHHPVNDLYRLVTSEVERPLFETVLDYTDGNQTRAAQLLGISRSTLRKKIVDYALTEKG